MSLLLYVVMILISASTVVFGLGWVFALEPHYDVTTVKITSHLPARRPPAPSTTSTLCDSRACAAAYYSFRASDCSYQPYLGPRRICTKGTPPAQARQNSEPAGIPVFSAQALAARAEASACNMTACEAAYKSFDPTDCTYQPYDGPRRTCNK
jgi:hypothetical protein